MENFKPKSLSEMNAAFAQKLASSAEEKQVSGQTPEENNFEPQVEQVQQPIEAVAPVQEETPPVAEAPVYETPAYEAPAYETHVAETPAYEEPVYEAPIEEAPVYEAPAYEAPVEEAPVYEAPAYEAPVEEAPVYEAPAYEAPVEEAPVYDASAYDIPTEEPEEEINLFEEVKLPIIDENADVIEEPIASPVQVEYNEPIPTGYFDFPKEPEAPQEVAPEVAPIVEVAPEVVPVVDTPPEIVPIVEEPPVVVPVVETAPVVESVSDVLGVVSPAPEEVAAAEAVPEIVPVVEEAPEVVSVEEPTPEIVPIVEEPPVVVPVVETAPVAEAVIEEAPAAPEAEPKFDFEKVNYYPEEEVVIKRKSGAKIALNISIIAVIILSLLLGIAAFATAEPGRFFFGNGLLVCNNAVEDAQNLGEGTLVFVKQATDAANNAFVAVHQGDINEYKFLPARSMAEGDTIFAVAKSSIPLVGKLVSVISSNWIIFAVLAVLINLQKLRWVIFLPV